MSVQLLFFTGPRCTVCQALKPKVKALLEQDFPQVEYYEVNAEEEPATAASHMIFTLPAVIILVDGKEQQRFARSFSVLEVENKLARIIEKLDSQ